METRPYNGTPSRRPYARNIFFRVVAGDSPDRGNVCYNRVGRGLAPAARCPFSEKIHARIKSHQNPRAGEHSSPLRLDRQTPICHPERSEGSQIAQNKNMRNEILRLTAQNDNRAGAETRPYNGLSRRRPLRIKCNAFDPYKPQIVILSEAKDRQ